MNANSEFSIRFMRRVAIVFFELGAVKKDISSLFLCFKIVLDYKF